MLFSWLFAFLERMQLRLSKVNLSFITLQLLATCFNLLFLMGKHLAICSFDLLQKLELYQDLTNICHL